MANEPIKITPSGINLLITGVFLITLMFISYAIFMNSEKKDDTLLGVINNIFFKDEEGEIDDLAAMDSRDENIAGVSDENEDQSNDLWIANDYKQGEISTGNYTVQKGDTLWEIAEAVYGSGYEWHKILEANRNSIGFLPNGSQALIITGQNLRIP